jgi:signal transduction histidine kinase
MALQTELIQLIQQLSFCRDSAGVMAVLCDSARRLTGADGLTVVLRDGDLCHYVEEDAIAPLWKGRRFPLQACISGWCILNRRPVAIPDIYADARIPHEAYRPTFVRSLAMTPIRTEDPIGAIGLYWANHHEASTDEMELLQALGDSAGMAFANVGRIEELREANRRKEELLAMLAHELRNPLAPLSNALYLLRLNPVQDALTTKAREIMERQVQQLTRIVDDLLDVARLRNSRVSLCRERLDLAGLIRQIFDDRRSLFEQAGLALEADLPEMPVWVQGDPIRLTQVLGNLLGNAGKFTPAGGRVSVHLSTDPQDSQAVVTVRDTGVGIAADLLPHVFDIFAQAEQPLDRSQGGLGLGLSVARGLLELHGGTIRAASDGPGHGAEITLRLPQDSEMALLESSPHLTTMPSPTAATYPGSP